MKQLLILFIFFAFTKEKISYKSNKMYSYEYNCLLIKNLFDPVNQSKIEDYPLNAQYCRLNDPIKTEITVMEQSNIEETTTTEDLSSNIFSDTNLRNLEDSQLNKDKCCYISILPNSDNSDWIYFCGKINSTIDESGVSEYVKQIKGSDDFKNKNKDIKIDCFSQKLDFMINVLIISLIYLI